MNKSFMKVQILRWLETFVNTTSVVFAATEIIADKDTSMKAVRTATVKKKPVSLDIHTNAGIFICTVLVSLAMDAPMSMVKVRTK